jgi:hypothetical protein
MRYMALDTTMSNNTEIRWHIDQKQRPFLLFYFRKMSQDTFKNEAIKQANCSQKP